MRTTTFAHWMGENSFHGMGMLAAISNGCFSSKVLTRRNVTNDEILKVSVVDIHDYKNLKSHGSNEKFKTLPSLQTYSELSADILWKMSWHFSRPIPSWSGVMETVYDKQDFPHTGKSSIAFLPIIDLSPSDMSRISSTLKFLSNFARSHSKASIITFDQPLYWKGEKFLSATGDVFLKNVVLILGPFHTQMNVLGCVGTLMANPGLSDIFDEIYGENAVHHILLGKAYLRAIRGHFLVDLALNTILIKHTISKEYVQIREQFKNVSTIYEDLLSGSVKLKDVEIPQDLVNLNRSIEEYKKQSSQKSKTVKLRSGYQNMITILRKIIHADRESIFQLQLESLRDAPPISAAAGHFNYAKSAYLDLQRMLNLPFTHPDVYDDVHQ